MKLTQTTFLISDLHFGHDMLCKMLYRPKDYNEKIIEGWNSVVTKHDKVLVLGDVSFVNKDKTRDYMNKLHGQKYLIRGNHDGQSETWFKDVGFEEVCEPIFKRFKDKYENYTNVVFTHEPVAYIPNEWFNIHGHMHGNTHRGNVPNGYQYFDMSVDAVNYVPMKVYEVLDKLAVGKKK